MKFVPEFLRNYPVPNSTSVDRKESLASRKPGVFLALAFTATVGTLYGLSYVTEAVKPSVDAENFLTDLGYSDIQLQDTDHMTGCDRAINVRYEFTADTSNEDDKKLSVCTTLLGNFSLQEIEK